MTLCEKCLHEEVCDQSSRQMWSTLAGEKECSDFKDRTNYAEVVRCKDCIHRVKGTWAKCIGRRPEDFCSNGERRFHV